MKMEITLREGDFIDIIRSHLWQKHNIMIDITKVEFIDMTILPNKDEVIVHPEVRISYDKIE